MDRLKFFSIPIILGILLMTTIPFTYGVIDEEVEKIFDSIFGQESGKVVSENILNDLSIEMQQRLCERYGDDKKTPNGMTNLRRVYISSRLKPPLYIPSGLRPPRERHPDPDDIPESDYVINLGCALKCISSVEGVRYVVPYFDTIFELLPANKNDHTPDALVYIQSMQSKVEGLPSRSTLEFLFQTTLP